MFSDLRLLMIAVVIAVAAAYVSKGRAFIGEHGLFTIIGRHLTGHTMSGVHLTDAGWFSSATDKRARTNTGRTRPWWYKPRAERMGRRCARYTAIVFLLLVWKDCPPWEAILITVAIVGTAGGYFGWRAWRRWCERSHYRTWIQPLHLAAARQVGLPAVVDGRSWLQIEPDRSYVRAELPQGYNPSDSDKKELAATFIAKLGIEGAEPRWNLAGPNPTLELLPAASPPPEKVRLADVRDQLDSVKPDELVWGIGKKSTLITTSLSGDSPHIGLSIGSGGGKSIAARSLLAQMLYRGALGVVLDIKDVSQHWVAWSSQLPNVIVARTPAEIHNVLLGLAVELTRRNRIALEHADVEGYAPPEVIGPRLIVVGEELNATAKALRAYWREVKEKDDPVRSPALNALDSLSFMGRQANMNLVFIGQRLSVAASGGDGDSRENIGTIALGRYSPSNWRMMAPDFPMPPKSMTPGRLQVVTDKVQEVQGIYMNGMEARKLAIAGEVASFPPHMPGARVIAGRAEPADGAEQHHVTDTSPVRPELSSPAVTGLVTLVEASEQGIVERTPGALRQARFRGQLPEPAGMRGLAQVWDPEVLREWDLESR